MQAGDLDRRVHFRRGTLADDGFGETLTFAEHGDVIWAAKRDLSDGEKLRAGEVAATIMTRFTIRWSAFTARLSPKDTLVCEGLTYEIVGIKETEARRRFLELTCTARTDL